MAAHKTLESADALVALRALYFARFSSLGHPIRPYPRHQRLMEEIGDDMNDHRQVANSKLIGRQALLLDEPLRQSSSGRVLRLPLGQGDDMPSSPSENGGFRDDEQEDLSKYSWGLDENGLERIREYQKDYAASTRLIMMPSGGVVRVNYDSSSGVGFQYGSQGVRDGGSHDADKMYCEYIDEQQCCSLGGWLNGS